jgi:hypothetical protein
VSLGSPYTVHHVHEMDNRVYDTDAIACVPVPELPSRGHALGPAARARSFSKAGWSLLLQDLAMVLVFTDRAQVEAGKENLRCVNPTRLW